MKRVAVFTLLVALLLSGGPAAFATEWGADSFSAPDGALDEAEQVMGQPFGSVALYTILGTNPDGWVQSLKVRDAFEKDQLLYVNINSRSAGRAPICFVDVASGNQDGALDAWAAVLRTLDQSKLILTFNHEPAVSNDTGHQPKCQTDNAATYKQAFARFVQRMRDGGVTCRMAYVGAGFMFTQTLMLATKYAPSRNLYQVVGADLYRRGNGVTAAGQILPVVDWRDRHAPGKQLLVGELGQPAQVATARWVNAVSQLARKYDFLAVEWNLRDDFTYNPLHQSDAVRAAWLAQATLTHTGYPDPHAGG
jgi:hypothetical protein